MPEHGADGARCLEWCPICRSADILRADLGSPELREQWQRIQREALLTMRTLIDHYLEHLERAEEAAGPRVEDIPIE